MFKKIARWILREEISDYELCVEKLTKEKDGLTSEIAKVSNERNKYKERLAASVNYVLPNGVVSKIIAVLPNPNEIGLKPELKLGKDYVIQGEPVKIEGEMQRWFFEVKFEKLEKISDVKILLHISLRNNMGYSHMTIPAVVDNIIGHKTEVKSWVWNFYEAGVVMVPDDIYYVFQTADTAWDNVRHEIGL